MTNSLTYFRVDGAWRDVEQPIPDLGAINPAVDDVSAFVDFFPGTATHVSTLGVSLLVQNYETYGDTEIAIAPITARTINAYLTTIAVGDPKGVELVANSAFLNMMDQYDDDLYYHVRYRNVTYGGALQGFSNFAFKAPTDSTGVRLTSPVLTRYTYRGP